MLCQSSIDASFYSLEMLNIDLHVRDHTLRTSRRLMDHYLAVRGYDSFSLSSGCQQEGPHRGTHTHADSRYLASNILNRIIDSPACSHGSSRAIYKNYRDWIVGYVRKVVKFGYSQECGCGINRTADVDCAVFYQLAIKEACHLIASIDIFCYVRNETHTHSFRPPFKEKTLSVRIILFVFPQTISWL